MFHSTGALRAKSQDCDAQALIDSENISNVLGRDILHHKPRGSVEWPDWQLVSTFLEGRGCTTRGSRRYFFNGQGFTCWGSSGKPRFLRAISQWLFPVNCTGNVDPFIIRRL